MAVIIQLRHDSTANWAATNPILAVGELGYDYQLNQHKMGTGTTPWNSLPYYGAGIQGATGPAGPKGQVVINFGVLPGSNEASVVVSDTNILSTSIPTAAFAAVATSDHTISDHSYMPLVADVSCGAPTVGVGFTIYATSLEKISGTFNINYVWS